MNSEKNKNQKDIKFLKMYSLILTIVVVVVLVRSFSNNSIQMPDIIRAKGVVIEDEMGKARIIMGAPIPFVKHRIRTDTNKVKELWAKKFPENWFGMYKNEYNHQTNGILILDENGHDRIVMGSPVPDLYFGKRIGPGTGLIINDEKGQERTGYGILNVDGVNRVNLGMDNEKGTEGIILTLNDDGTTGLVIRDIDQSIFLGKADSLNWFTKEYPFNGLFVNDSGGTKYDFNSWNKIKTTTNKK